MNEMLEKLPDDKRDRIIDVCIEEFGSKGYKHASTNSITEQAGISKGLLFHYFKNKKTLYLNIIDYVIDFMADKILKELKEIDADDFFVKMKKVTLMKISIFLQYPNHYQLLISAFAMSVPELKKELGSLMLKKREALEPLSDQFLYHSLESASLRSDIPVEKAIEIIKVLFDYLGQKYAKAYEGNHTAMLEDPNPLLQELDLMIDILKYGLISK